ncbi:MAG: helix-turn-helix domain-containing protein [Alistipes sp.]|nr:helix-turn-helix domain-containing protein [Alistipes sp.]
MKKQIRNQLFIEKVGRKLRRLREAKGESQETVYFKTSIHIGRVERGQYNITISTLKDLCEYYGISVKEFWSDLEV